MWLLVMVPSWQLRWSCDSTPRVPRAMLDQPTSMLWELGFGSLETSDGHWVGCVSNHWKNGDSSGILDLHFYNFMFVLDLWPCRTVQCHAAPLAHASLQTWLSNMRQAGKTNTIAWESSRLYPWYLSSMNLYINYVHTDMHTCACTFIPRSFIHAYNT